jgi:hypothetical protein
LCLHGQSPELQAKQAAKGNHESHGQNNIRIDDIFLSIGISDLHVEPVDIRRFGGVSDYTLLFVDLQELLVILCLSDEVIPIVLILE